MKIYNTLTGRKEEFVPLIPNKVKIYACGVTVYDHCHIGHARSAIVFDVIRRYMRYKGFDVKYVRNFTDIDDKIINRAKQEGITWDAVAKKYTAEYYKDMDRLGVGRADVEPKATEHIEEIIGIIKGLIEKGYAYEVDSSVYFSVAKFPGYGKLSKRDMEEMTAGARVEVDERKKNPLDFALWKKSKEGEPSWESPWGLGRPGWHIECSVMIKKFLGEQIDIHAGAQDLMFPHHENEIAQTEALAKKKPFVKYWLHGGLLMTGGQKMSKSLGNFITIEQVLEKWEPRVIRMFVASSRYQSKLDWSEKNLLQAKKNLERMEEFVNKLKTQNAKRKTMTQKSRISKLLKDSKTKFEEAMEDNFNTPEALAVLFEMIKAINPLFDKNEIDEKQAKEILEFLKDIDKIFNFIFPRKRETVPQKIKDLAKMREKCRTSKQWREADKIREQIERLGFELKDAPTGPEIKKK